MNIKLDDVHVNHEFRGPNSAVIFKPLGSNSFVVSGRHVPNVTSTHLYFLLEMV